MGSLFRAVQLRLGNLAKCSRKQRRELLLFFFINLLIFTVFIFGLFVLLPAVCEGSSWIVYGINYSSALWIFVCVTSNYNLLRIRNSSIQNHILIPPPLDEVQKLEQQEHNNESQEYETANDDIRRRSDNTNQLTTDLKNLAEGFTSRPFNSDHWWHICGACETLVPPRSWHCGTCGTCIFRRDHHCIFAAACVGEDNQCNFLGFLFYLAIGSFYANVLFYIHMVHILKISRWMWLVKCLFSIYTLIWEFQLESILATIAFAACLASSGIFLHYVFLALRGQTSADSAKHVRRHEAGEPRYSYKNLERFLGPKPVQRVLWPFHELIPRSFEKSTNSSTKHL